MRPRIKLPCHRYVLYLLSRRTYTVVDLIAHLGDMDFVVQTEMDGVKHLVDEIRQVKKHLRFPTAYNPHAGAKMNTETRAFLRRHRILDYWTQHPSASAAIDILLEPAARRYIEVLLLGPVDRAEIAIACRRRFGYLVTQMNVGVVRTYEHYFWDKASLSRPDWESLLWTKYGANDDYLMALRSTPDQTGVSMTFGAAQDPRPLTNVAMYTTAKNQLFKLFMQHVNSGRPSLSRTNAAILALQGVTHAEEQIEKFQGGSADLLQELERIDTLYDNEPITTIHQLEEGSPDEIQLLEKEATREH